MPGCRVRPLMAVARRNHVVEKSTHPLQDISLNFVRLKCLSLYRKCKIVKLIVIMGENRFILFNAISLHSDFVLLKRRSIHRKR